MFSLSEDGNITHLAFHILCIVLSVDFARGGLVLHSQGRVPDLSGKAILKIQQTCLANVLDLGAGLANYSSLVSHATARIPTKYCEWPRACTACSSELLFGL